MSKNKPFQYTVDCLPILNENLSSSSPSSDKVTVSFVGNITLSKLYYEDKKVKHITIPTEQLWNILKNLSDLDIEISRGKFY